MPVETAVVNSLISNLSHIHFCIDLKIALHRMSSFLVDVSFEIDSLCSRSVLLCIILLYSLL